MRPLLVALTILMLCSPAYSATLYLDNSATNCTDGATTYDPSTRACGSGSDTVYVTPLACSRNIASSDHVYIRAGSYYQNVTAESEYSPTYGAANHIGIGTLTVFPGIDNVTIENYNDELVWIQSGTDHTDISTDDTNYSLTWWGANGHLTGNGGNFRIWGTLGVVGSTLVIDGLDLQGGGLSGDPWGNVIFFYSSGNSTLRNTLLGNNVYQSGGASANDALLLMEDSWSIIIENCRFYSPIKGWVYTKYQNSAAHGTQVTFRYNVFEGPTPGDPFVGASENYGDLIYVYQNIFMNSGDDELFEPWGMSSTGQFKVYNNTFYNMQAAVKNWHHDSDVHDFFNNIVYVSSGTKYGVFYDQAEAFTGYLNYNDYYASAGFIQWGQSSNTYTTITDWRTATGQEANSVTTDPSFLNASGQFNVATDFKRSSYPTNGRGGSWPNVMGAYITGNETIGLLGGAPNPPINLIITPGNFIEPGVSIQ